MKTANRHARTSEATIPEEEKQKTALHTPPVQSHSGSGGFGKGTTRSRAHSARFACHRTVGAQASVALLRRSTFWSSGDAIPLRRISAPERITLHAATS